MQEGWTVGLTSVSSLSTVEDLGRRVGLHLALLGVELGVLNLGRLAVLRDRHHLVDVQQDYKRQRKEESVTIPSRSAPKRETRRSGAGRGGGERGGAVGRVEGYAIGGARETIRQERARWSETHRSMRRRRRRSCSCWEARCYSGRSDEQAKVSSSSPRVELTSLSHPVLRLIYDIAERSRHYSQDGDGDGGDGHGGR